MVSGTLRHLSPFVVRFVEKEELLGMVVDDILGRGRKAGVLLMKGWDLLVLHQRSIRVYGGRASKFCMFHR